jgi:hypothetical protein
VAEVVTPICRATSASESPGVVMDLSDCGFGALSCFEIALL